jgi:hypothetical protein
MRLVSFLLILIISVLGASCDNETVDDAANFKFETVDKEKNTINLIGTIRYRLKNRFEKNLIRKYGRQYKDSLLIPTISTISSKILKEYSAGEIYNYKRSEIVQKLDEQAKVTFAEYEIEVTNFSIWSVELPDTLRNRLEKEYVTRFQNAMNNCSKETNGIITKNRGSLIFYKFVIKNKNFEGILNPEKAGDKVSIGDSLVIEYACEDPVFHRVKK